MQLIPLTNLNKNQLDFRPRQPWPAPLPPIAWNGFLICGFEHEQEQALNATGDHKSLGELLKAVYQELTLPEWARLLDRLKPTLDELSLLTDGFDMRISDEWLDLVKNLQTRPEAFQNWCEMRGCSVRDLSILRLCRHEDLNPHLESLARLSPTRNEGVQIIELLVEILEMGRSVPKVSSLRDWLFELKNVRLQKTTETQKIGQAWASQLTLPQGSRVEWVRKGDQEGLEFHVFVTSQHEAKIKLQRLGEIEFEKGESPWTR